MQRRFSYIYEGLPVGAALPDIREQKSQPKWAGSYLLSGVHWGDTQLGTFPGADALPGAAGGANDLHYPGAGADHLVTDAGG
jgi:hypothetical protein